MGLSVSEEEVESSSKRGSPIFLNHVFYRISPMATPFLQTVIMLAGEQYILAFRDSHASSLMFGLATRLWLALLE